MPSSFGSSNPLVPIIMPTYHVSTNTVDDFGPGNEVLYVPIWVNGDASHPDCETGVVVYPSHKNHVLVRFYDKNDGHLEDARATNPKDLINMSEA